MLKSMKKKLNETKGFTLIEVIVVLVIIAILMAIAVPNVLGYINRAKGTEAQAVARSIYMAATAESAEILKGSTTMKAADFATGKTPDRNTNIKELANFEGTLSAIAFDEGDTPSVSSPANNSAVLLVDEKNNVIAGVVYCPTTGAGDDEENLVTYNGYTGDINVGKLAAVAKNTTSSESP